MGTGRPDRSRRDPLARRSSDPPLYGSLTSGSRGDGKLPIGFADQLLVAGLLYDTALTRKRFGCALRPKVDLLRVMPKIQAAQSLYHQDSPREHKTFILPL